MLYMYNVLTPQVRLTLEALASSPADIQTIFVAHLSSQLAPGRYVHVHVGICSVHVHVLCACAVCMCCVLVLCACIRIWAAANVSVVRASL